MSNFQEIAQQFVQFYYQTFDSERSKLASLYRDQSMLTFESSQTQGASAITEKLVGLPFQKVQHRIDTTDAQPANQTGGILVMVTGALVVDDQPQPMSYVQTFQLAQEGGNYYVQNDIFKLVYPAGA